MPTEILRVIPEVILAEIDAIKKQYTLIRQTPAHDMGYVLFQTIQHLTFVGAVIEEMCTSFSCVCRVSAKFVTSVYSFERSSVKHKPWNLICIVFIGKKQGKCYLTNILKSNRTLAVALFFWPPAASQHVKS